MDEGITNAPDRRGASAWSEVLGTRIPLAAWLLFGLFFAAWATNTTLSMIGWDNTLLGPFQFRQLQTAMSAQFYPTDGFALAYETPLFGSPWSVPLEFPLYQASVARFSDLTGLALDPAGRLVSWLWFQLGLVGVFLLLGSLGIRRRYRWIPMALLVTSPVYLFYSRAFLIESTVTSLSIWFLAGFCRWLVTARWRWLVVTAVAGGLAAAMKPTTLFGFSVFAGLFCLWELGRGGWREAHRTKGLLLLRAAAAWVVPVWAGVWWQFFAAAERAKNPDAEFLNVMFGYFGFGDFDQRLSLGFWQKLTGDWSNVVLSEAGCVVLLFLVFLVPRRSRWIIGGLLAAFMSSQLVFANLYFVHEYYQYAVGLFLILALGIAMVSPLRGQRLSMPALALAVAVIAGLQVLSFSRFYLPAQTTNVAPPELVEAVKAITHPDETIIVLGQDWDAVVPYYAQRRSLMLIAGRERDAASIKASVERLVPESVGAFVNLGHLRSDAGWVASAMGSGIDFGRRPLLLSHETQTSIWVPRSNRRVDEAALPLRPYPTLNLLFDSVSENGAVALGRLEIARMRAFDVMEPRPVTANSVVGFSEAKVEDEPVLNVHAPATLTLQAGEEARSLSLKYGIHEAAYLNGNYTDGVQFEVVDRRGGGEDQVLFSHYLNPMEVPGDRGIFRMTVDLPSLPGGEVLLRLTAGPVGNSSCDWSYVGAVELH